MADGMNGYSLADIGALMGSNGGFGGGMSWIAILFLFVLLGGNGGWGFGGRGEQYATSNDVNRGFDNQNQMANQREILSAVTAGTAQSVAATNQVFHDLVGYVGDKYAELDRDVLGVSAGIQQVIANENQCCCNTLRAIDSVKFENAQNTTKILEAMAQNKIEALQEKVRSLELAQATQNTVKYPNTFSYNAGPSPFCGGCGCGCGCGF